MVSVSGRIRKSIKHLLNHVRYVIGRRVTYENIQLCIDRKLVSRRVAFRIFQGKYEKNEKRIISETLHPNDRVFEIGTGIGFISMYCALTCRDRNIFTYEANPLLVPLIKKNFKLNNRAINVDNCVLVHRPETDFSEFYVCKDFYSSSLTKPASYDSVIKVPNKDFLTELRRVSPTCLIVDIEGFEYELFRNVELPSCIAKVLIELHPEKAYSHFDLVAYFRERDFMVSDEYLEVNQLLARRSEE